MNLNLKAIQIILSLYLKNYRLQFGVLETIISELLISVF